MYHLIAIAGTFDRLHKGHRYFIRQAFRLGHKVIIGLTSDEFARKKLSVVSCQLSVNKKSHKTRSARWQGDPPVGGEAMTPFRVNLQGEPPVVERTVKLKIQKYLERKKELEEFLTQENLLNRAEIVEIDDVYGPTIEETKIEALVVTRETLGGARLVNKKRKYKGLKPLKIFKIPLIPAEDKKRIASTRIRWGEIDRLGRVLRNQILNIKYQISDEVRLELKKPLGELLKGDPDSLHKISEELKNSIRRIHPIMIITVGDEVTKLCNEIGIIIDLAIFDYKVGRTIKYSSLLDLGFKPTFTRGPLANGVRTVRNPAGHITKSLVEAVRKSYLKFIKDGRQQIIRVIGEEDLAGVPAILLSPLGSVILYGQPGEGVVFVEVTEEKKKQVLNLIHQSNIY